MKVGVRNLEKKQKKLGRNY